jgi:hypothetical protein
MHLSNTVAAINNLNYVKAILHLSTDKGRAGIFGYKNTEID